MYVYFLRDCFGLYIAYGIAHSVVYYNGIRVLFCGVGLRYRVFAFCYFRAVCAMVMTLIVVILITVSEVISHWVNYSPVVIASGPGRKPFLSKNSHTLTVDVLVCRGH